MKRLIIIVACAALWSCTHTFSARSDLDERLFEHEAKSGLTDSYSGVYAKRHRPSQYERCLERKKGAENAERLCSEFVRAGMPDVNERCNDCVDSPFYGNPYGMYGY
jgi:hypothetical protein